MKKICLLGASGSVGSSSLKIIRKFSEFFELHSFSVHSGIDTAKSIIEEFSPRFLVVSSDSVDRTILGSKLGKTEILYGSSFLETIVSEPDVDVVLTAIVGSAGLLPTVAAIRAGKKIAIANKETLVTSGPYIKKLLKTSKSSLIPVDSEHNALFQLLEGRSPDFIHSITLTASGGPFRELALDKFSSITLEDALQHPTWKMGPKITIDSAGMINKGLEVIEAHYLFDLDYDKIEVVVHPESIVHGLIETKDGASILYASYPDMIFPVAHALFYPSETPKRLIESKAFSWKNLRFWAPESERYPGLKLAYQAGKNGGTAPAIFNAANEEAVQWFIEKQISFTMIPKLIERALETIPVNFPEDLESYIEADKKARQIVRKFIKGVL
ncbi:MAG: 1-deoxy-D-xylulose-5-phosphate reductoisomerase [Leptospiraceae bacterium]|nr:1-deoxy-D-xylulose-5-phosphate reductoisomerase [Leptospiraceae bacterium]MCP5500814.1 1-deoxy-D-xylulose-5-phosphate reductoisomerase [Leptospiraceae bacterium]